MLSGSWAVMEDTANGLDWKVLQSAWSGVYWTRADRDTAVISTTGSHCGGQATSAAESAFELRWPIAGAGSHRVSQYSPAVCSPCSDSGAPITAQTAAMTPRRTRVQKNPWERTWC